MKEDISIIFKTIIGSHAHGTNIEGSDVDIKGIYIQSPESILDHGYREQYEVNPDEVYYELRRVVELCCTSNPTMLEIIFSPEDCILEKHPVMDILLNIKDQFLSKSCKYSFGGYAKSQISKASGLQKKMNWSEDSKTRSSMLDFCFVPDGRGGSRKLVDYLKEREINQENIGLTSIPNMGNYYGMFYSPNIPYRGIVNKTSTEVRLSSIPKSEMGNYLGAMYYNQGEFSKHCKNYTSYQKWLKERNTQRYVDIEKHNQKIDGKNMLHCIRLCEMSQEIAEGRGFNVRRPNPEYLISIRKGKVDLKSLLDRVNEILKESDSKYENSKLPEKIDPDIFMEAVKKMRKAYHNSRVKENHIFPNKLIN